VLVGGASRRFGTDKAAAMYRGRTLLDHALATLHAAGFERLAYVGGTARPSVGFDAVHVPDIAGEGCTLRGVISLLEHAVRTDADDAMMLACDVPRVNASTITQVIDALRDSGKLHRAAAAVAFAGRDHWSCLAVTTKSLPTLRASFEHHEVAMHRAFASLHIERVLVDEHEMLNANEPNTLLQAITNDVPTHE